MSLILDGSLGVTVDAGTAALPAVVSATGTADTGLWFPAADTVAASTAGTERMRIDSSGNVGIGTTSPTSKLDVNGNIVSGSLTCRAVDGEGGQISLNNTTDTATAYNFDVDGSNHGRLFTTQNNTNLSLGQLSGTGGLISLYTGGTERLRIDSSGGLMVNTTSMMAAEQMGLWYSSNNGPGLTIRDTAAQNGNTFIRFSNGATAAGNITTNGTTSTSYGTSSDYRMKENIQLMSNTLEKVLQLKPCTYNWKQEFGGSSGQGFIAHELQAIVPDCVTGEKDAVDADGKPIHQGIDTSFLVATLTAAIQELKAIIDTQAAQITALNAKVGI